MKRFISFLFITMLLIGLVACGGGKYSDAKEIMEEQIKIIKIFINEINKGDNAKALAAATNKFSSNMNALIPKINEMIKKYPELKEQNKTPKELEKTKEELSIIFNEMVNASMKIDKYLDDPEVTKASEKLREVFKEIMK